MNTSPVPPCGSRDWEPALNSGNEVNEQVSAVCVCIQNRGSPWCFPSPGTEAKLCAMMSRLGAEEVTFGAGDGLGESLGIQRWGVIWGSHQATHLMGPGLQHKWGSSMLSSWWLPEMGIREFSEMEPSLKQILVRRSVCEK